MSTPLPKPPAMKKHTTGQWFCKWGGRFCYFGRDDAAVQDRSLDRL
ncbi:MAG: hypothetical protein GXY44_02245 [Phycisphaerales bacterium]|nr:hypothetical protein [Phycisphaerales bacterium]